MIYATHNYYRACVVDLLGLGVCVAYISIDTKVYSICGISEEGKVVCSAKDDEITCNLLGKKEREKFTTTNPHHTMHPVFVPYTIEKGYIMHCGKNTGNKLGTGMHNKVPNYYVLLLLLYALYTVYIKSGCVHIHCNGWICDAQ